jgi:hypothetical protein
LVVSRYNHELQRTRVFLTIVAVAARRQAAGQHDQDDDLAMKQNLPANHIFSLSGFCLPGAFARKA